MLAPQLGVVFQSLGITTSLVHLSSCGNGLRRNLWVATPVGVA